METSRRIIFICCTHSSACAEKHPSRSTGQACNKGSLCAPWWEGWQVGQLDMRRGSDVSNLPTPNF